MAKERDRRALAGGNAGDPEQMKLKGTLEERAYERRLGGWRYLLATPIGRELAWAMLADCNVFTEIMAQSPWIFANAGRQTWGIKLMDEMIVADEDNYLLMQKEAIERKRALDDRPKHSTDEEPTDG